MKILRVKKLFLSIRAACIICAATLSGAFAAEMFSADERIQGGLDVFEVSKVFTDIYKKLDTVSWGGKNINIAIEGLEKINPNAHIAATDERVVLVWKDTIVANFPRPANGNFDEFGQITTALVLKMRTLDTDFASISESMMYQTVVGALMQSIDENGRYVYSKQAEMLEDGRLLTGVGLDTIKDERGNFRVTGVFKDSPADAAGIKLGDIVSKINGQNVMGGESKSIADAISGFNSGTLKIGLITPTGDKNVVLRRATIVFADADVIYRGEKNTDLGILEIVINKMSNNAVSIVSEALTKHQQASGIILDLRMANGDDEIAAAKLIGMFVGKTPVMRILETAKSELEIVPGGDRLTNANLVVLVSNATSGTAEAAAATVNESRRGILVGTPTAGTSRIATKIDLDNGGAIIVLNKIIKTGTGRAIDGRGIFPSVCLSNIRNVSQQGAFFINVINGDFVAKDFNKDDTVSADVVRRGCPIITSGDDEDAVASAVAIKILTDKKVYNKLMSN